MYEEIRQALLDRGYDEWMAEMTAEKIDDAGAETILEILQDLLN